MAAPVYITGTGIISAIGQNTAANLQALIEMRTGIGNISLLHTLHRGKIPAAEIKLNNEDLLQIVKPAIRKHFSRTGLLAVIAAREALVRSGIETTNNKRVALLSSTTVGGMDTTEQFFAAYRKTGNGDLLPRFATHDCGDSTEAIADELGLCGMMTTFSTACSSSANAIMMGARLIRAGLCDMAVAGGADALCAFTLNGFNSLLLLDSEPCKPFDENRRGLNLGEAAAYLVLESERSVRSRNATVLAQLSGWANANDAHHQTASSPDGRGATLAMQQALKQARLSTHDIGYINMHGTATPNNDLSEGTATRNVFGKSLPPFSSTKAYTGHTLAAAAAVEAVYAVLALQHQTIFPNLNFSTPISELGMIPETTVRAATGLQHVLSNSFGFGGNCSSLIFSKS